MNAAEWLSAHQGELVECRIGTHVARIAPANCAARQKWFPPCAGCARATKVTAVARCPVCKKAEVGYTGQLCGGCANAASLDITAARQAARDGGGPCLRSGAKRGQGAGSREQGSGSRQSSFTDGGQP